MGHDFIDYEDRHVRLNDAVILILHHFLTQTIRETKPADMKTDQVTFDSLTAFLASWKWAGPGVWIGTDFTVFVEGMSGRHDLVVNLLDRVSQRIDQFGESIPLRYLQERLDSELCYFTAPQPTAKLRDAIRKLAAIFQD